jgi:hypothetical protein
MIHGKKLTLCFWGEAAQAATYVLNRSGSRTRNNRTPYELWIGRRPTVDNLRIFGSIAYAHISKQHRRKLDSKSLKTISVGYCPESKAYRLWDSKRRRIIISRDVTLPSDSSQPHAISALFLQPILAPDLQTGPANTPELGIVP